MAIQYYLGFNEVANICDEIMVNVLNIATVNNIPYHTSLSNIEQAL